MPEFVVSHPFLKDEKRMGHGGSSLTSGARSCWLDSVGRVLLDDAQETVLAELCAGEDQIEILRADGFADGFA